uniref:Uncharacterized protein n=1 Tax=Arundo donax TaxID=35708 RepID=A0A0A9A671_ARUDO
MISRIFYEDREFRGVSRFLVSHQGSVLSTQNVPWTSLMSEDVMILTFICQ